MSHAHAIITAERFRQLADETQLTAYQEIARDHAGMPGSMAILAVATIMQDERERSHIDAIRAADPRTTQEMPVLTMADLVHGGAL